MNATEMLFCRIHFVFICLLADFVCFVSFIFFLFSGYQMEYRVNTATDLCGNRNIMYCVIIMAC